ncbi:hypothetical protein ABK040_010237 [Willaertia magna]
MSSSNYWKGNKNNIDNYFDKYRQIDSVTSSIVNNISNIPSPTKTGTDSTVISDSSLFTFETGMNNPSANKVYSTLPTVGSTARENTSAIHVIETKVQEIEAERKRLASECDSLKTENKWFRKKVGDLESLLRQTEEKHLQLKKIHEDHEGIINTLERNLEEYKKKEKKRRIKSQQDKQILLQNKQLLLQTTDELNSIKNKLEIRESRSKALEIENEFLQKQIKEYKDKRSEDRLKHYEADLTNERMEREYAQDRIRILEREKEKLESDVFDLKLKLEKVHIDYETARKRDKEALESINKIQAENTLVKDRCNRLEQKVIKYKRKSKQLTLEKQNKKQPLCFNAWVQTEETYPSFEHVKTRDETIMALNNQVDGLAEQTRQLRGQLEYFQSQVQSLNSGKEELLAENTHIKGLITDLQRQAEKNEQKRRMLERELEIKQEEIEKKTKYIRKLNETIYNLE